MSAGSERSERRVSFITPEESSDCWTGLRAEGNGSVNDDEWREARWRTALCGDLISRSGVSVCLVPLRQTAGHIIESSRHSLQTLSCHYPSRCAQLSRLCKWCRVRQVSRCVCVCVCRFLPVSQQQLSHLQLIIKSHVQNDFTDTWRIFLLNCLLS